MTPKEKAVELVNKFKNETDGIAGYNYDDVNVQCALIAVDEIIEAIDFDWMEVQNLESEHRYWQQVKEEIEKL
jgi:hypothetical protein